RQYPTRVAVRFDDAEFTGLAGQGAESGRANGCLCPRTIFRMGPVGQNMSSERLVVGDAKHFPAVGRRPKPVRSNIVSPQADVGRSRSELHLGLAIVELSLDTPVSDDFRE